MTVRTLYIFIVISILGIFFIKNAEAKFVDTRKAVVVLDTGVDLEEFMEPHLCKGGHMDVTGRGMDDKIGHGTNIVNILKLNMDVSKYCLLIVKYYDSKETSHIRYYKQALNYINTLKVDYLLFAGDGTDYMSLEKEVLSKIKTVVVAAGNGGVDLDIICNYYPVCYKLPNIKSVGSAGASFTNKGSAVNVWVSHGQQCFKGKCMTGTSQASALHMSNLIRR